MSCNFGFKRPVSRASSAECLADSRQYDSDIALRVPEIQSTTCEEYICPYSEDCGDMIKGQKCNLILFRLIVSFSRFLKISLLTLHT